VGVRFETIAGIMIGMGRGMVIELGGYTISPNRDK
jgi:hypothetical protein